MRRRWLLVGAVSAAALAIGGGSLALLQPGVAGEKLSAPGRQVFAAVARGLLAGTIRTGETDALLGRIDAVVAALPPHAQSELSQLLALLASAPGRRVFAQLATPWDEATVPEIQGSLQAMRLSRVSLRRQAYQALHDIVGAAYFADAGTWTLLGYPGPVLI